MCLDSGPLTAIVNGKVTVVGVVSFGGVNCPVNLPSAYARVSFQKDWILENTDAADWQCNGTNSTVTPGLDLHTHFPFIRLFIFKLCNTS
jgi:secreted trypsin-like serine protease